MLKLRDLATRSDFEAGPLYLSPSTRRVRGPAGEVQLEPLIMQVFLLLFDAEGRVVTRDELFDQCWGGVIVGDDSLNRAIAKVRRISTEVAPGSFEIETIPRTGYRLTGGIVETPKETSAQSNRTTPAGLSRRSLVGGAVVLAAAGGTGLWWFGRPRSDSRFNMLLAQSEERLKNAPDFQDEETKRILEEAVSLRPESAKAWGMLALVRGLESQEASPADGPAEVERAQQAVQRALGLDPKEPNALLAMYELQGATLDWITRDRSLRRIIAIDPRNILAISELAALLQAAGLNRESWTWNERALGINPLARGLLVRRALKLWIARRANDADKVIDQTRALYPSDAEVWRIQFLILALTDRARGAQAMLESDPQNFPAPLTELWRSTIPALIRRSPGTLSVARQACLDGAKRSGELAANGVMILSALREVDAAFDVVNGFLLWRGSIVRGGRPAESMWNDAAWRMGTQWLFTPPCAVMRSDARFIPLCTDLGITAYWKFRGLRPDYQVS